jgi:2-polyprenyl-6-hydroxyphenyl methylase/3-demethylubiquinone-9 3-methyltransferase
MKPNGFIVLTTPNGEYFMNNLPKYSDCPDPSQYEAIQFRPNADGHIFLLHLNEIEKLASYAGLNVKEVRLFTNPLSNGHIKLGTLLNVLPHKWVELCENLTTSLPLQLRKKVHVGMAVLLEAVS